jgi:hypothetical protein
MSGNKEAVGIFHVIYVSLSILPLCSITAILVHSVLENNRTVFLVIIVACYVSGCGAQGI